MPGNEKNGLRAPQELSDTALVDRQALSVTLQSFNCHSVIWHYRGFVRSTFHHRWLPLSQRRPRILRQPPSSPWSAVVRTFYAPGEGNHGPKCPKCPSGGKETVKYFLLRCPGRRTTLFSADRKTLGEMRREGLMYLLKVLNSERLVEDTLL